MAMGNEVAAGKQRSDFPQLGKAAGNSTSPSSRAPPWRAPGRPLAPWPPSGARSAANRTCSKDPSDETRQIGRPGNSQGQSNSVLTLALLIRPTPTASFRHGCRRHCGPVLPCIGSPRRPGRVARLLPQREPPSTASRRDAHGSSPECWQIPTILESTAPSGRPRRGHRKPVLAADGDPPSGPLRPVDLVTAREPRVNQS
jgi:hypothetical protein